jgi:hypothetical protein
MPNECIAVVSTINGRLQVQLASMIAPWLRKAAVIRPGRPWPSRIETDAGPRGRSTISAIERSGRGCEVLYVRYLTERYDPRRPAHHCDRHHLGACSPHGDVAGDNGPCAGPGSTKLGGAVGVCRSIRHIEGAMSNLAQLQSQALKKPAICPI